MEAWELDMLQLIGGVLVAGPLSAAVVAVRWLRSTLRPAEPGPCPSKSSASPPMGRGTWDRTAA